MEEEIEEKLKEIYNLYIDVKFVDFRQYNIFMKIDEEKAFCIPFLYDARATLEANITTMKSKINNEIIKLFLRKEEK